MNDAFRALSLAHGQSPEGFLEWRNLLNEILLPLAEGIVIPEPPDDYLGKENVIHARTWKASEIPIARLRGDLRQCHANVASLYRRSGRRAEIATGYAFYPPCLWVRHSWIIRNGRIGETTAIASVYWGLILDPPEAELFCRQESRKTS